MTAGDFDPSDRTESAGLLDNPLNAFRYSGKRFDSGSGSIDMGARRFGPDTGRFLQRDNFNGATADLGLSLDPLTQNRYALASGNPISFVEWDGHLFYADGGGGGATSPTPSSDDTGGKILKGLGGILYDNTVGLVETGVDFATNVDKIPGNLELAGVALTHLDMTVAVAGDDLRAGVEVYRNLPLDEQIRIAGDAIVGGFGPKAIRWGAGRIKASLPRVPAPAGATTSFEALSKAASASYRGQEISVAGRALQKHGGRPGSAFPQARGTPLEINQQALNIVDQVLQHPNGTRTSFFSRTLNERVVDIRIPGGPGIRYADSGRFIGFLEP